MRLLSVNVGMPRAVVAEERTVTTGIFKSPVEGRVQLRTLGLDGDGQADLTVHGGINNAVYAYPSEHYTFWRAELPGVDLPWGAFGENLDTDGLLETEICSGDELRIGSARLRVTSPRLPCFKLGIKFGDAGFIKRFLASRRSGFYLSVLAEGDVGAGDTIEILARDPHRVTVADIVRVHSFDRDDLDTMRRAVAVEALPEDWREHFRKRLAEAGG